MKYTDTHIYMHTHTYAHTSLSPVQVQKQHSHLTPITQKGQQEKVMLKSGKLSVSYIRTAVLQLTGN